MVKPEFINLAEQEFNQLDELTQYFVTTYNKVLKEILEELKNETSTTKK